jgi:hypothetical protein
MVTHLMLVRRWSLIGRTRWFRIARAALALPGRDSFRRIDTLDAGPPEPRDPAMQQRALRHRF